MRRISLLTLLALVVASCGGGKDPEPQPVSLKAPGSVELHGSPTTTSLTFQWTAVSGATSYDWRLYKGSAQVQEGTVRQRNITVSDLEPGTAYRFSVRASDGENVSEWSSWLDASTEEEPVTPVTPPVADRYDDFGIPEVEEDGVARAFPGAEGGGMYTTGGRGGSVYHVTSLEDTNTEGTLRYGIEKGSRPLTIVFDVAGIIPLTKQLNITKGNLTIAGQSAPGDGICLKNYTFRISASNVIVRFIRCRMGDEAQTEDDAIQVLNHTDDSYSGIIIDHCSVSWCTDECASFYGMKDFTFQWNYVTESLRASIHNKGNHGYGGIWGGNNASYHHNLLAHHDSRNPRIDHDYVSTQKGPVSIFNNVVYNWSGNTCYGGESSSNNGNDYRKYNFFNNYYKPGPATPSGHLWLLQPTTSCSYCGGTILPGHFYMDGNILEGQSEISGDNWMAATSSPIGVYINASMVAGIKETEPFPMSCSQSVHSAADCLEPVLNYAGASYSRDAIDRRIAEETQNGTYTYSGSNGSKNGLIDTQTDVGGWPEYTFESTDRKLKDSDADGMPDWFEEEFGLSKTDKTDAAAISLDKNGRYTNLEMYLHYLVKDIVAGGNAGGSYEKL